MNRRTLPSRRPLAVAAAALTLSAALNGVAYASADGSTDTAPGPARTSAPGAGSRWAAPPCQPASVTDFAATPGITDLANGGARPVMQADGDLAFVQPASQTPARMRRTESWAAEPVPASKRTCLPIGKTVTLDTVFRAHLGQAAGERQQWHSLVQLPGQTAPRPDCDATNPGCTWRPVLGLGTNTSGQFALSGGSQGDLTTGGHSPRSNWEKPINGGHFQDDFEYHVKLEVNLQRPSQGGGWISLWSNSPEKPDELVQVLDHWRPGSETALDPGTVYEDMEWLGVKAGLYRGSNGEAVPPTYEQSVEFRSMQVTIS